MKFARLVERGQRQILLTVEPAPEGSCIVVTTHYQGLQFLTMTLGGFDGFFAASEALGKMTDDEIIDTMSTVIEAVAEDDEQ